MLSDMARLIIMTSCAILRKEEAMTEAAEVRTISEKRAKFIELTERRTSNAIKAIEIIGNLGNRANYEFNGLDARKIVVALKTAVETVNAKMNATGKRSQTLFNL